MSNSLYKNGIKKTVDMTTSSTTTVYLTASNAPIQIITGSVAQNINLPVVSTINLYTQYFIVNNSTATVTVASSGSNTITTLSASQSLSFMSIATTGTTAASWTSINYGIGGAVSSVNSQTGAVVLTADSISDTSSTHKFTNASDVSRLSTTSGTNTGDQSTIVGITGTMAQFNTAVTDGDILYVGQAYVPGGTKVVVGDGGTGRGTATAYAPIVGGTTTTGALQSTTNGSTGQVLQSAGSTTIPTWSTATYPATAGTLANVLTSDGTNWQSSAPASVGLRSFQVFTSGTSATYTKPTGITSILIEVLGGGGGGAGVLAVSGDLNYGGGGGAGGYARLWVLSAASTYTYTVGGAGAGGAAGNNNGASGGTTTFGSLVSATGGSGGVYGGAGTSGVGAGGTAGIGSNGNINGGGSHGGYAIWTNTSIGGQSGHGGHSIYGQGGQGSQGAVTGANAVGYGSGGAGAGTGSTTNRAGGSGTSGLIIVWEFTI